MPHRLRGINYRVLTTLLLVGIPVLLIGSFFVIERGRAELRQAFGRASRSAPNSRRRPSTPTSIAGSWMCRSWPVCPTFARGPRSARGRG